uniref:MHD domain-containing protein n=1 Tax=Panagrolaimus superbus TaxID=310955 RepID=A0A914Z6R6_9BILA
MTFLDGVRTQNDDPTPTTTTNAPLVDEEGFIIRPEEKPEKNQWSSCTSSDDEDEIEFQASKIRQLQIKPVNESNTNINASVDELRNAIGHISLQRSTTFDKDPWSTVSGPAEFSQSLNIGAKPLRAAFTGDEHLRRKASADNEFAASFNQTIGNGNTIARARPRSNTPTALTASAFGLNASMSGMSTITSNSRSTSTASSSDVFGESKTDALQQQTSTSGFSDSFANFNSSSNLPLPSSGSTSTLTNPLPKKPIAMAVNEFAHAWFKQSDPENPEVKVFGTVVISFPSILFPLLTDVTPELDAVKFSLEKAGQIQTIIPNKRLLLPTPLPSTPAETYNFTIDKLALANWLLDQKKQKPDSNFYNVDIVRYELKSDFVPPLILRSYWKMGSEETGIRVDYNLNETAANTIIDKPLLNITFTTKIDGENAELTNSSPPATFNPETGILSWLITELTKHGEPSGSLKARLKLSKGVPSSTHVMFQTTDINFSTLSISMNSETCYNLSMTKRKIIAGKYFCEPEVRN